MGDPLRVPVLHLVEHLRIGGDSGVMRGLSHNAPSPFHPILAGIHLDPAYAHALQSAGVDVCGLNPDAPSADTLDSLAPHIRSGTPFLAMIHRAGAGSPPWDTLIPRLRRHGARLILVWNHFSEVDRSPAAADIDLICFGSRDSLWRHWIASGQPDPHTYLQRHRVLHCPIRPVPPLEAVRSAGAQLRARLGIPPDAFVIGDVCRPAPEKLDWMLVEVFPRLCRLVPQAVLLTREYPTRAAAALRTKVSPSQYVPLPLTSDVAEMTATYGAMDVLAHMTTMGESFGMALAEAQACGVPVVVNETPNPRCDNAQGELVRDGVTGFLASDPARVLDRLLHLARDPVSRKTLGEASHQQMHTPPYAPDSIRARFWNEVLRLADAKGWAIPLPRESTHPASGMPASPDLASCIPSDPAADPTPTPEGLAAHVRAYRNPPPWSAPPWTWFVQGRRLWWRIRRKRP